MIEIRQNCGEYILIITTTILSKSSDPSTIHNLTKSNSKQGWKGKAGYPN